jgi:hypothetical protein
VSVRPPLDFPKLCRACDQTKARRDFYPRANSRDGLYSACKPCFNAGAKVRPMTLAEKLDWFIDSTGDGCHEWDGNQSKQGYGIVVVGKTAEGKPIRKPASRAVYELANGPLPDDVLVRHTCDNPPCCRLDHLIPGTHVDNRRDAMERGRTAKGKRNGMHTKPESRRPRRGEKNGMAKLTEVKVEEIRQLLATGGMKQRDIAAQFGVTQSLISMINTGKQWSAA